MVIFLNEKKAYSFVAKIARKMIDSLFKSIFVIFIHVQVKQN